MYKQRDILLIPIPFTDLSSNKKRPVIVISNDYYNKSHSDIVVAAITSNLILENNYSIDIDNGNLEDGEIPLKSRIRCDKIYTLSKTIVVKKFSRINQKTFSLIQGKIILLTNDKTNL